MLSIAGESLTYTRCMCCNRVLTDTLSVSRGVGPECWSQHGPDGAKRYDGHGRVTVRKARPIPAELVARMARYGIVL